MILEKEENISYQRGDSLSTTIKDIIMQTILLVYVKFKKLQHFLNAIFFSKILHTNLKT